jgi:hypothetical protein
VGNKAQKQKVSTVREENLTHKDGKEEVKESAKKSAYVELIPKGARMTSKEEIMKRLKTKQPY